MNYRMSTLGITLLVVVVISYFLALWTEKNLEFWLGYFKGEAVDIPFWMSWALSIVLNAFIIALNLISEIIQLMTQ